MKKITYDKVPSISIDDINEQVVLLTENLGMSGGSIGDIDLYQLLQVYLKVPESRSEINNIVLEKRVRI